MKIASRDIAIKNQDKVLFPRSGLTKKDLIDYYDRISGYLLPFLIDRPLTLRRFPDGIQAEGFYQKECPGYFPDWIETATVKKKEGGTIEQVLCNNKATLIYLANQGTIELHPWLSRIDKIDYPDKMVFDLDPPDDNFEMVRKGAKTLHRFLNGEWGLKSFPMTSGSKGIHVVVPLTKEITYNKIHAFAKKIADLLSQKNSADFTTEVRKNKRGGRLFLDYLRNSYAQTSIAPYSLRALERAPVAVPLRWDELDKQDLSSRSYHMGNIFYRLGHIDQPWKELHNSPDKLREGMRK